MIRFLRGIRRQSTGSMKHFSRRDQRRARRIVLDRVDGLERRELLSTVVVPGQSNIYGAGITTPPDPGGGGAGISPKEVDLSSLGNPKALIFPTVTGMVSASVGTGLYNGPNGGPYFGGATNLLADGGISGMQNNHATMFLVGVFLGPNGQPAKAPATLNASNAKSTASFAPLLGQQFFIGNGRTADKDLQSFTVPAGATRLFLGFADGYQFGNPNPHTGWYNDNGGTLSVDVETGPTTQELYEGAVLAYGLSAGTFTAPLGWTELEKSPSSELSDGFAAVAVRDPQGNLIILNEGTVPGLSSFDRGTEKADIAISAGATPTVLQDAADFAKSEHSFHSGTIYVAGHSLGGIEAEMECKTLGTICGGGATFGATGLPGNTAAGPTTLEDFVDYGDPVGNASTDPGSPLASLLSPSKMLHYGKVTVVGSPSDANGLTSAVASLNASIAGTDSWAFSPDFGGSVSDAYLLAGATDLGIAMKDHVVSHYGADLNLQVPVVAEPPPIDVSYELYGIRIGNAGFHNFQNAVVQPDGSLVSPDFTVALNATSGAIVIKQTANVAAAWGTALAGGVTTIYDNASTGLPISLTYVSPDKTLYSATLDPGSEQFKTLQVNENNGGSYQINYDLANTQTWSSSTSFFKASNEKGPVFQSEDNWDAGGSQLQTFTNLPPGDIEELQNYAGPNDTGKLISTKYIK